MTRYTVVPLLTVASLHSLLWSSILTLSIIIYFYAITAALLVTDMLLLFTAGASLLAILIHVVVVKIQQAKSVSILQFFCSLLSCTTVLLWIASVGLDVVLTLVRHSSCPNGTSSRTKCILQRTSLAASILALISSSILCLIHQLSNDPFTTGLFGIRYLRSYISAPDPEKSLYDFRRQSTLSFQCRSSTTLVIIHPAHQRSINPAETLRSTKPTLPQVTGKPRLPSVTETPRLPSGILTPRLPSVNPQTHLHLKSKLSTSSESSSESTQTTDTLSQLLPSQTKSVILPSLPPATLRPPPRRTVFHKPFDVGTVEHGTEQLAPPPGFRQLASLRVAGLRRVASFASVSSSVYSRNTGDEV